MGTCAIGTQIQSSVKLNEENPNEQFSNISRNHSDTYRKMSISENNDEDISLPLTSQVLYNGLANSPCAIYAKTTTEVEELPTPGSPESIYSCAIRLLCIIKLILKDSISKQELLKNINYAILVLESAYIEEAKRICNEDDDFPNNDNESVPDEVHEWLSNTFTRRISLTTSKDDKPKFRSVANAIRAGIMVERIYRRMSSSTGIPIPPNVMILMKEGLDSWNFNLFELDEASDNHSLKYLGYELFHKYNFMIKFKIDSVILENFLQRLEEGYSKFSNPYHTFTHAADVAQTCHIIISQSGLSRWMTDLEILAILFSALIHDYEHTGTTNPFHINSSSDLALLYNDRGVLENHHISSVFRLIREESCQIFKNLSKDEYRELRLYVIEIVLNTDMSLHFQQMKNMKTLLAVPENVDKMKAFSLLVHCADISHPTKNWDLHEKWTYLLVEEFFRQGDIEKNLGLACSPLCDRNTTVVAQSQIGFIDFIVEPSFVLLGDMLDRMLHMAKGNSEPLKLDEEYVKINRPWSQYILENKEAWKLRAPKKTET